MITAAEIKEIPLNANYCYLRIPAFESTGAAKDSLYKALISVQPGQYNCYKPGDKVWILFKDFHFTKPIVIGMILNDNIKTEEPSGQLNIKSLKVASNAVLPMTTTLNVENTEFVDFKEYDTILKCVKALKDQQELIRAQQVKLGELETRILALEAANKKSSKKA